jgi:hypothetical protein
MTDLQLRGQGSGRVAAVSMVGVRKGCNCSIRGRKADPADGGCELSKSRPYRISPRRATSTGASTAVAASVGGMRTRRLLLVGLAACSLACTAAASAAKAPAPLTATFVGDSVAASITYVPAAEALLEGRGLKVRLDLAVCRRLVQPSCPYRGSAPSTALEAVQSPAAGLGSVLVVDVGYNETADGYGAGIDRVMRAAIARGAAGVVWVTLHETSPLYRATNATIRAAAGRWPQLVVADWDGHSAGRPWFRADGLHLTVTGATALATFLRPYVFRAAAIHA